MLSTPSASLLYEEASQILGYDLLALCLEGPQDLLNETRFCQVRDAPTSTSPSPASAPTPTSPALPPKAATVVTSLAAVEFLHHRQPAAVEDCMAVAGFSVGEITAAVFTGGDRCLLVVGDHILRSSDLE